jgi:hypothetical protein
VGLWLLVPVLVIPLGLLSLNVVGTIAIFMVVELARIPVLYSLSVAAVSFVALWRVVDAEWAWLVARAWMDFGWLLCAAGEMCSTLRGWFLSSSSGVLWLFFSGTARRSGLHLRACERWGKDDSRH